MENVPVNGKMSLWSRFWFPPIHNQDRLSQSKLRARSARSKIMIVFPLQANPLMFVQCPAPADRKTPNYPIPFPQRMQLRKERRIELRKEAREIDRKKMIDVKRSDIAMLLEEIVGREEEIDGLPKGSKKSKKTAALKEFVRRNFGNNSMQVSLCQIKGLGRC